MFDNNLKPLEKLGLTRLQSQVFLANFSVGPATAKQIAFQANIAREEVYRTMPSLQGLGLVKKHFTSPIKYETIELADAMKLLIDRKEKETEEIIQSATNLYLQLLGQNKEEKPWINFEDELILLSNNELIDLTISNELRNVKQTLDITVNWDCHRFKAQVWDKMMSNLLDNGLKIRVIMNLPDTNNFSLPKSTIDLMKNPKFETRYLEKTPECIISIYDGNRGFIFNSNCENNLNPPVLWTSNPTILSLIKCYFETTWKSGLGLSYQELYNKQIK